MPYRSLNPDHIIETTRTLSKRVSERFPQSGLSQVCIELLSVAEKAAKTSEWISRPNIILRISVGLMLIVILFAVVSAFMTLPVRFTFHSLAEVLQATESAINDIVFIVIAALFLFGWENRIKRKRALKAIHELRSLAHIIDMHQLTKDPERILNTGQDTPSSPIRKMTPFELERYLDYCSEMLAIISKIAAVYVQKFDDHTTLGAVNELENLTSGLSRKIWQKIMILDRAVHESV